MDKGSTPQRSSGGVSIPLLLPACDGDSAGPTILLDWSRCIPFATIDALGRNGNTSDTRISGSLTLTPSHSETRSPYQEKTSPTPFLPGKYANLTSLMMTKAYYPPHQNADAQSANPARSAPDSAAVWRDQNAP